MMTGLERSVRAGSLEQLDRLRRRLAGDESPPVDRPQAIREALEPLVSQDSPADHPAVDDAVRRLVLMAEVWDCLDAEGPEAVGSLPGFFDQAIDRLCSGLLRDDPGEAAAWIGSESEARWGDYLALIDPSVGAVQEIAPQDERPEGDDLPAIDAAELLRKLSGIPVGDARPTPGRPSPHEPTIDRVDDDGPAIDAAELLRKLTCLPGTAASTAPPPKVEPAAEDVQESPGPLPWWERVRSIPAPSTKAAAIASDPLAEAKGIELDPELRAILVADLSDLFGRIQELVLGLGAGDDSNRLLELGRCYHTLKGAAGSAGLLGLAATIHDLEDQLEEAGGTAPDHLIQRMEASLSVIEGVLAILDDRGSPADSSRIGEPSRAIEAGPEPPRSADEGGRAPEADGLIRMPAARFEELVDLCSELLTRRRAWAGLADQMKGLAQSTRGCSHRLRGSLDRLAEAVPTAAIGGRRARSHDPDELAGVLRRMGEQTEDLGALAATAREAAIPMATEAEDLARLSLRLWEGLQSVRIVPVRGLFQRLNRVARDAARVEGRTVEVVLVGEETGADRSLLDKAYEPMLHIVRNAVGHGIEPPECRVRAGKPPAGRITLEAHREGNTVVLSVQDDGKGLDHEAIAAKGRRLGLIGPDEQPGVDRLNGLIFHPGFSTRSEANSVSGRGVGMDVVAREVGLLRGRIEMTSTAGRGTRLAIHLPARISLEPVMVVRARGQAFAVPTSAIDTVNHACRVDRDGPGSLPIVAVGDRELPMMDLGSILGFSGPIVESCPTVLVVTTDSGSVALRVDGIDGPLELVLKPLGPLLAGHPAVSGAGLSPGGEVIPSLNVAGLLRLAGAGESTTVSVPMPAEHRPAALVVDDSLSVRRIATRRLRALGFDVDEASDGEEALGRLRGRSYRLVMTDLEMPRMDGFALLSELGRTGVLRATSVLVTSTLTDEATRRRVLDLGAMRFLPKPVDPGALAAAVAPLLDTDHGPNRPN